MPKINPYDNIKPMVYAYTNPEIARLNGWTKIGYTEKQTVDERIRQQTHTANILVNLEWKHLAKFADNNEYFNDHAFHDFLEKYKKVNREQGTEWFNIDGKTSEQYFYDFRNRDYSGVQQLGNAQDYVLRREQNDAVLDTYNCYKQGRYIEFLWNAKPRFGKTLSTYDFIRMIKAKNVLIVTNRPSIANSWYEDFEKFISWQTDYVFVSECDTLGDKPVLSFDNFLKMKQAKAGDVSLIAFESLQGLKGSVYFGGYYDKLQWIRDVHWDLLVIDEAHEGVDTYKTDTAFDQITRDFTLHLSGTPFKAIASGKFTKEQIYNWTFADEQEAKENWNSDSHNPYEQMPRMNLFTYQMSKIINDEVSKGLDLTEGENVEYAFDLNEFFRTEKGKFVYEKDVKKFIEALYTQNKFPFSTPALREELAHTFWLLARVDSVKALEKLLKEDRVFRDYEIVIAAGSGRPDEMGEDDVFTKKSYDRVKEAIEIHQKTITLSVGQLTTGVTIPEWTAVMMLSNMKSPAEYVQASFRAQNPYRFEKNGKYYEKSNAYVFDFAPERTLMIFDDFANSLYSDTTRGEGTKDQREKNISRLLNFFSVFAEDDDGEMVAMDATKVLTIPIAIKTEEVIKRGFMSNFLFANIGNVFAAPTVVTKILEQIKPEEEQGRKPDAPKMDQMGEVSVDDTGTVNISNEIVVNKAGNLFGAKIYNTELPSVDDIMSHTQNNGGEENLSPMEQRVADVMVNHVVETVSAGLYGATKEEYGLSNKEAQRIENKVKQNVTTELTRVADGFSNQKRQLEVERDRNIKEAKNEVEKEKAQTEFNEKLESAEVAFKEEIENKAQELKQVSAEAVVKDLETKKEEIKKRAVEGDVRAHLRGFARTIPSFIMAYGDDKLTLSNFDSYPTADVFQEVTSITLEQFKFLRDGGDYTDEETGELKHFEGHLFDEVIFNESIQAFLEKKKALANYFDESNDEDIFDYIPPQETNQIFTPKKVVQLMVDELEKENSNIFDAPDKTFVDFYMKSGLYITEIVKRLYKNQLLKSLFPNDQERIKHILECQVFGFAPTQIIFDIAMAYIFGFDESGNYIKRRNFFSIDTLPYAENGTLDQLVQEQLGRRVKYF